MAGSILGNAVRRSEDPRLLTGQGRFVDDLELPDALYAVFVRANLAHAKILSIDTSDAVKMPGVAGVWTEADLGMAPARGMRGAPAIARQQLATDTVRFVGEPVAVVLADTRAQAVDAAEAVVVDYDPLPAVTDPLAAAEDGAPVLFGDHGSNIATQLNFPSEQDALEGADVVVSGRFINQRVIPVPMETNGCAAAPDPETGGLKVWVSTQGIHGALRSIARAVELPPDEIHAVAPAVGGGFGAKGSVYPEQLIVCKLAHTLGRAVRYAETRSENMTAMTHGRAQVQDVQLGVRRDGTITGLKIQVTADAGAYPAAASFLPFLTRLMSSGTYRIPKIDYAARVVVTNTTSIGAYRGAGRPEAAALVERIVDMAADELGIDPVEIRRKNFIPPDAFPHETVTGAKYDVGDYDLALTEALRLAGYDELRREQAARREREDRKLLGIGVACYVETTGGGSEFGSVDVSPDGAVTVYTGTSPHGQGHETAWAQIAAELMKVPFESVRVVFGDTKLVPKGGGTMGSRSLQLGGSAVYQATEAVIEKAKAIASHLLEASVEDIVVFDDGKLGVAGVPGSALGWAELAKAASENGQRPDGMDPGLSAELDFQAGGSTFPFGAHVSVVEVDSDTGKVELLRHVAVDDAGTIVNPMLVQGQQHGGIAQGVAQAVFEGVDYDSDGNPLSATLATYAMPSAAELCSFEASNTETATPLNPLGAKGIGESATIGSTPAVQNAVVDALSHLGIHHLDMPFTPEKVWRAIQEALSQGT